MKILNAKMLRIYLKETDKYKGMPLYRYILKILKENGIAGATILRGFCGYGIRGISEIEVLRLSMDLPVIVECIEYEEKLLKILPMLVEIIGENGLISIMDTNIVKKKEEDEDNDIMDKE
ncbi:DUF190 domain-containing protein [Methanothermococcus okinawensis]|uniref:Uncharacterized protein n=1 Tax=Methanothermococcus okinawensis (strain DSM 14208 / JCM 11175 / IH1) TaxID=647113 RepID=F8AK76_METOI|nr:DUF190 domain-containing protein [Methanothermococcus okinawensis]AEH07446.1 protein of unknown function DUF190 [Methanothermococcus okinawensis IH1]